MSVRILLGDIRERLKDLPDESVHMVCTSPPYYNLRDYQTASWAGGDPDCDHLKGALVSSRSTLRSDGRDHTGPYDGEKAVVTGMPFSQSCGKCGAVRTDKQIGLEPTPAEFVAVLVEVFREVRRVMRPDATLFLNLGDSYQDKQLLGIPWRVAFALQADGWYLRSEIIWAKANAMPESVRDRPTKAHEQIFLLSKSPKYHYDAEAIAEPASINSHGAINGDPGAKARHTGNHSGPLGLLPEDGTRNRRSVWTVATAPFSGAHFAVFPPALIEPCILAGCPKDCCAKCGAPVVREVERGESAYKRHGKLNGADFGLNDSQPGNKGNTRTAKGTSLDLTPPPSVTLGWSPSCTCDAGVMRGTVLDPFGGAGTTGLVADRLQRNAILIELNGDYLKLAADRITDDAPLFASVNSDASR